MDHEPFPVEKQPVSDNQEDNSPDLSTLSPEQVWRMVGYTSAEETAELIKRIQSFSPETQQLLLADIARTSAVENIDGVLAGFSAISSADIAAVLLDPGSYESGDERTALIARKRSSQALAENLGAFQGLDSQIAEKLIKRGFAEEVFTHRMVFEGLSDSRLAEISLSTDHWTELIENLPDLHNLSTETAKTLVMGGMLEPVLQFRSAFADFSDEEIVEWSRNQPHNMEVLLWMREELTGVLREVVERELEKVTENSKGAEDRLIAAIFGSTRI